MSDQSTYFTEEGNRVWNPETENYYTVDEYNKAFGEADQFSKDEVGGTPAGKLQQPKYTFASYGANPTANPNYNKPYVYNDKGVLVPNTQATGNQTNFLPDAPAPAAPASTTAGEGAVPGASELNQKADAALWKKPGETQDYWGGLSADWNKKGQGLVDQTYDWVQGQQQRGLDNVAAASGRAGSGAAITAGTNLSAQIAAQKAGAMRDWTALGGQLAAQADSSGLAHLSGAQVAANSAQNLQIQRITGGITTGAEIASGMGGAASGTLNSIYASQVTSDLAMLEMSGKLSTMTATQRYQKAAEIMATIPAAQQAVLSNYIYTRLGVTPPASDSVSGNTTGAPDYNAGQTYDTGYGY